MAGRPVLRAAALAALLAAALVVAGMPTAASAYYLPGAYPREFSPGEVVEAQVNSLTSDRTETPLDHYSLPFCKPPGGVRAARGANPGLLFSGARIEASPYNFTVMARWRAGGRAVRGCGLGCGGWAHRFPPAPTPLPPPPRRQPRRSRSAPSWRACPRASTPP